MGGEKLTYMKAVDGSIGSPPHGRGKEQSPLHTLRRRRITPAWAGKSIILRLDVKGNRDHPRMGGEKPSMRAN